MKLAISLLINCLLTLVLAIILFVEFAQYDEVFYLVCVFVLFAGIFALMAVDEFIDSVKVFKEKLNLIESYQLAEQEFNDNQG